eukprot:9069997-Lingulodinium_polyedra.AAC.1
MAIFAALVVRNLTNLLADSRPLKDTLAGGRQRHIALNVAVAIRDLARGPINVHDLPGLLDGGLNGSEQGV